MDKKWTPISARFIMEFTAVVASEDRDQREFAVLTMRCFKQADFTVILKPHKVFTPPDGNWHL
jgi:hypothetical protein